MADAAFVVIHPDGGAAAGEGEDPADHGMSGFVNGCRADGQDKRGPLVRMNRSDTWPGAPASNQDARIRSARACRSAAEGCDLE